MAKKINYKSMFTLRSDGRYQGYWRELDEDGNPKGKRHVICDKDPEKLYYKIQEKEKPQETDSSFSKIAEEWEAKHTERVGYKTSEAYRAPTRRLIERFGDDDIARITAQEIQAYLSVLGKQGYSRRTVQMHRDILNMIFSEAIVSGVLSANPCTSVSMPRNLSVTKRCIPSDEAIEAVKSSTDKPFGLFAAVCLYSGLRRGEALALEYKDIDRQSGVIHVTKAVEFVGNNPHIKMPKTEAGKRDAILLDVLAGIIPSGRGYLFGGSGGELLTKAQYRLKWKKYCESIGYEITAHQLRHGFATILYEAGVQDKDAQELLGHSNITITRNIYTHIRQSHREETAEKLNSYIGKS